MATYGHQGGYAFNEDQRDAWKDEAERKIEQALRRMRSVDIHYIPAYPGGQKQFDEDCQVLAAAYLNQQNKAGA